ncbi:MAG: lipopolysaccharide heptosyltransferase II [Candidatus Omnitrophica bacterium]|nr:lipopolysaccharide heptosyltransferase II [Candidatus Omnitrophota bacterium]
MNILQLVPELNIGGVEKGTVEVARYLTLNGHKAVVVSGGGVLEKDLAAIGARHYRLPVGRKNPFTMLYAYMQLKKIIAKENIHVVHARSRIPALTGFFAARSLHRTFLTTAHGQYRKKLISRVMGWGKFVITANETMARYMKDNFSVPLGRIRIIPRGVDLKRFSFIPREERRGKTFRVGMICRFTPLKGHLDFLKAVSLVNRKIPNLEAVIMGDTKGAKEEYIKKLRLTVRQLLLNDVVKFVDSSEDVAAVMAGMDVLVSANRLQEAFGRTVIEAQARGTAVLATRIGGVLENVEDGKTGLLCEPADPEDMAEKILEYASSPGLLKEVTSNAREYVEKNFSLENVMARTVDVYREAMESVSILVLKISALGDVILSTPSLKALRNRFRNARIKVLTDVRFREVLSPCPYIDDVIACDLRGRDRGRGFLALASRLRAEHFDVSVDLQNSRKSHLLPFLSVVPERYGYDNGKFSFLLNRKISLPVRSLAPVEHQAYALGLLGIRSVDKKLELWPDTEAAEKVEKMLKDAWLNKGQRIVAVSLSASAKWQTKNWGLEYLSELSEKLAREKGIRMVLVGTEADRRIASEFMKMTTANPIDLTGKTGIPEFIGIIRRSDVLLSGDSSPIHVAAAVGTPFVALFGPTDPARHIPPADDLRVIHKKLKCSPCYRPVCRRKMQCMRSIKPEDVYKAIVELMPVDEIEAGEKGAGTIPGERDFDR